MKSQQVLWFLGPSLIGLGIFYIIPFIGSLYYAFVSSSAQGGWAGLDNFYALFRSDLFMVALGNTLLFMFLIVPIIVALSFSFSMLVWSNKGIGGLFKSVMLTTYVMPTVAVLLLWSMLFHQAGTVNAVMGIFGIAPVDWMKGGYMRWPVILMFLWKNIGFNMIIILASLNAIPREVLESSLLDGAGWLKRQIFIVVPHIVPTLVFVVIISMINSLRIFKEAYILAGPYPDDSLYTLQHFMYNQFNMMNYNYVVSSALLFLLVIFALVGALFLFEYKMKE